MALLQAEFSHWSEEVSSLSCWPEALLVVINVPLLTVDRYTHHYIIQAVCFAGRMIPHMGFLRVGGEDILKGVFSGNDQKAEL